MGLRSGLLYMHSLAQKVENFEGKAVKHQNFKKIVKKFCFQEFRLKLAF